MNVTASEVKQAILDGDDFGHEIRVGRILHRARENRTDIFYLTEMTEPEHGGTYDDPLTQKARQFDYRCEISHLDDRAGVKTKMHLLLAVECKNLSSLSPLVICGRSRARNESHYYLIESIFGRSAPIHKTRKQETHQNSGFYPEGHFVGKSLVRLTYSRKKWEADSQGDLYDRWNQAIASSTELAHSATRFADERQYPAHWSIVFPIVVVPNKLLWTASYDDSGEPRDPQEVESCEFFVGRKLSLGPSGLEFSFSHIHFMTLNGFQVFLSGFMGVERRAWLNTFIY